MTREILIREGGRIEKDANGEEVFVIPVKAPKPNALELSWDPGPIAGSVYSEEDMEKILYSKFMQQAVDRLFPGWTAGDTGPDMNPGFNNSVRGKKNILVTHPVDIVNPCVLSTTVDIPKNKKTMLRLVVGHHEIGDWDLIIRVNGTIQKTVEISNKLTNNSGWAEVTFDLTPFAGNQKVKIDLENKASGWSFEAGYWAEIEIKSK